MAGCECPIAKVLRAGALQWSRAGSLGSYGGRPEPGAKDPI